MRTWFAARREGYFLVLAALCLNLPLAGLALTRYLDGVHAASVTGAYAALVLVGYYLILFLLLITLVFALFAFSLRAAVVASAVCIGGGLFYLVIDGMVYRVFRFHVDAFWLQYAVTHFRGWGVSAPTVAMAVGVLATVVGVEWLLLRLAKRIPRRGTLALNMSIVAFAAYFVSQAIHIVAYEKNDTRFTGITSQLPFYFPITSHSDAAKYAHMVPMIMETRSPAAGGAQSLTYPLREVAFTGPEVKRPNILMIVLESWRFDTLNESVSPKIHAFSQRSSVFLNHFSSANCTPTGIFSLFYGIHPTYWTAVKANAGTIDNPVLIDALQANDYAFGIFADSHFDRHKIKDTIFRGIDVNESFAGSSADENDRDLTRKLIGFIDAQRDAGRPYFGFAFYKSTHFSYYYPKESARFLPTHKLNIATANSKRDPTEFLNDYKNSVHYVDSLVGALLDHVEASRGLENTIVVITSDHGEEFNDNHANYWGHTGNFTGYQVRVPLVIHMPGHAPRQIQKTTAHIDVPPTLLVEGLGCGRDVASYSDGRNLFGSLEGERPMIVTSYVNHAVIIGDDVYSVFPVYVQKYKLWNIHEKADAPPGDLAKLALDGMYRFYRGDVRPLP